MRRASWRKSDSQTDAWQPLGGAGTGAGVRLSGKRAQMLFFLGILGG